MFYPSASGEPKNRVLWSRGRAIMAVAHPSLQVKNSRRGIRPHEWVVHYPSFSQFTQYSGVGHQRRFSSFAQTARAWSTISQW